MDSVSDKQPGSAPDEGQAERAAFRNPTQTDCDAVDVEAPIRAHPAADAHNLYRAYGQGCVAARAAGDESAEAVYRFLAQICSMGMNPSDPAHLWQPLITLTNGARSSVADDFRGDQTAILASLVGRLENPALRARIADIAWSNNRRDGTSAAAAIDAYCDVVTGLLNGTLEGIAPSLAMHDAVRALQRAMQIAGFTTKRTKRPEKIKQVFDVLFAEARARNDIATFVRVAELGLKFALREPRVVAADLEMAATAATPGPHPLAIRGAWDLAGGIYQNVKDVDGRQRCMKAAVEQTLAMRGQVAGNYLAEVGWIDDALQRLRHVIGVEEQERELELELRRLQKSSVRQMGSFEIDLGIGDTPERVSDHFGKLTLSDALRQFALLDRSRDPEQLRNHVLESSKTSPLMSMMSVAHLDAEGRTQSRSAGAAPNGEPPESWYRRMIGQMEGIHRAQVVRGMIEPARLTIQARFPITERHVIPIIDASPFVPDSQKAIVALGVTRLFQADHISATHLLIPQLEPCLRHVLKMAGHDPSKRRDDSTEEDLSLKSLFINFRTELNAIFGVAIASEIDHLFNLKPGPALRHEIAHGQLSAGDCYRDNVYYANWVIYRLCALPVMEVWDRQVRPQLPQDE